MAVKSIDRDVRASHINAQGVCQVVAKSVKVTLRLLDLGELLGAAGFCDEVNGELVGTGTANKVWEIVQLYARLLLLGLRGDRGRWCNGLLLKSLCLVVEVGEEATHLVGGGVPA